MTRTVRVNILDREYVLRVEREEDARLTRRIAEYVDSKMRAFHRRHPDRPESTAAVITALAIAEDLFIERERYASLIDKVEEAALDVNAQLDQVLEEPEDDD